MFSTFILHLESVVWHIASMPYTKEQIEDKLRKALDASYVVCKARYTLAQSWIYHESRPCPFGPVHTGNKVDRISNKVERIGNNVDRDKLSTSRCCRFAAKNGNKVELVGNKVEHMRRQLDWNPALYSA